MIPLRLWHYISHVLTYLLAYLLTDLLCSLEMEVSSLREQLDERSRLSEVMRMELETIKRAASRARTITHSTSCTVSSVLFSEKPGARFSKNLRKNPKFSLSFS